MALSERLAKELTKLSLAMKMAKETENIQADKSRLNTQGPASQTPKDSAKY